MKIIKPSVEFFGEIPTDRSACLRIVERCGRLCYKSEDKITADSAEGFVKRLIKAGHLAMVEHSNFVVRLTEPMFPDFVALLWKSWSFASVGWGSPFQGELGKYLNVHAANGELHVGGSLTAWYQSFNCLGGVNSEVAGDPEVFTPFVNTFGGLFQIGGDVPGNRWQVCPHNEIPKALHRYSAKFICDRGVSHELVRHRPCSFAQESTRYVNYGGKDMEFIEPADWCNWSTFEQPPFLAACTTAEAYYKAMLNYGSKPQEARAVLPNALKTEIVVTADAAEWAHIKKLRTHSSAHPDMVRVMNMMPWQEMGL